MADQEQRRQESMQQELYQQQVEARNRMEQEQRLAQQRQLLAAGEADAANAEQQRGWLQVAQKPQPYAQPTSVV